MSEVRVVDPETMRAGTVDLILIDDKGRIRIYDFKTKEGGFAYYQKPYDDPDLGPLEKKRLNRKKKLLRETASPS